MLLPVRAALLITVLGTSIRGVAQPLPVDDINTSFAGKVVFKVDRQDRLVMDFYDDGSRFRQDIAYLRDLDPASIHFSSEENAVVLSCLPDRAQCLTKEIFKLDVVRVTSRSTLPRPDNDADGVRSIALLQELVTKGQADIVQFPGETPTQSSRRTGHSSNRSE